MLSTGITAIRTSQLKKLRHREAKGITPAPNKMKSSQNLNPSHQVLRSMIFSTFLPSL